MNAKLPTHDVEHLRSVNALLEIALSMPESAREAWMQALPPDQQPPVATLSAMLAHASVETDAFLRRLPEDLLLRASRGSWQQPGEEVGPYRLIKELGAGGMATVWLAERVDGVLQRQVALKLHRTSWGHGLADRMARERQILGALEHPRIARLYDAGVTAAGRPWMALECVFGAPIDRHCEEQKLDVRQ